MYNVEKYSFVCEMLMPVASGLVLLAMAMPEMR
jgi:hypothetical protein